MLGNKVARDSDVNYAARGDVRWEEDGGKFDLFNSLGWSPSLCAGRGAYQSFVLGQQDCNACIDFADCQGDQHLGISGVRVYRLLWNGECDNDAGQS